MFKTCSAGMDVLSLERLRPPLRTSVIRSPPASPSSTTFVSATASPNKNCTLVLSRSAPSSPSKHARDDFEHYSDSQAAIPFNWEESPGTPKRSMQKHRSSTDSDFEFASSFPFHEGGIKNSVDHLQEMGFTYFSAPTSPRGRYSISQEDDMNFFQPEEADDANESDFEFASKLSEADSVISAPMSTADELFYKGRILPLKPPPHLQSSYSTASEHARISSEFGTSSSSKCPPDSHKLRNDRILSEISRPESNPGNMGLLVGMETSVIKGKSPVVESTKKASPFRFFKSRNKSGPQASSSNTPPQAKAASLKGSSKLSITSKYSRIPEPRGDSISKSRIDNSTLKNDLMHLVNNDSQRSNSDISLAAGYAPSRRWYDKSNNRRLENGAERSWPRSSEKTVLQTRSARNSSVTPSSSTSSPAASAWTNQHQHQQNKNKKEQLQLRGSRGSNGLSPHELHYRSYRASTEQARRATFLPYKRGLLGCFGFRNFRVFEVPSSVFT